MTPDFKHIKNIIFDLGAVIINIDIQITIQRFADFFGVDAQSLGKQLWDSPIWHKHEIGLATDQEVIHYLNTTFGREKTLNEATFTEIWNALLLDLPQARLDLLTRLKNKYRLFLLSNTNETHIKRVNEILKTENNSPELASYFEKVYYSYEMGLRKPDVEIYLAVLKDKGLTASETLFLDDNKPNIDAAATTGIHTIHVTPPHTIIELLANS